MPRLGYDGPMARARNKQASTGTDDPVAVVVEFATAWNEWESSYDEAWDPSDDDDRVELKYRKAYEAIFKRYCLGSPSKALSAGSPTKFAGIVTKKPLAIEGTDRRKTLTFDAKGNPVVTGYRFVIVATPAGWRIERYAFKSLRDKWASGEI